LKYDVKRHLGVRLAARLMFARYGLCGQYIRRFWYAMDFTSE